jgi:hypothetical protein
MHMKSSTLAAVMFAATFGWGAAAAAAPKAEEPAASPLVAPTVPEAVSLTPQAAEALRRKVLAQCGLHENPSSQLPWYFHFEYGRALLGSGDAMRAIGELTQAVELNPHPHASKRMYGMWYVDYFPYYQLAMAHAQLGNWTCAANAMRLSQMTEAATADNFDMVKYSNLQRQIEGKAPYTESCKKEGTTSFD